MLFERDIYLYHYTTFDAFKGIINNTNHHNRELTFWATNLYFMNDFAEGFYVDRVIKEYLKEVEDELRIPTELKISEMIEKGSFSLLKDQIRNDYLFHNFGPTYYTISFSEDSLSYPLWNMYADEGRGVALVFNKYNLLNINNNRIETGFCHYFRDSYKMLKRVYLESLHCFNDFIYDFMDRTDMKKYYVNRAIEIYYMLMSEFMFHKNEYYIFEKEFRIYIKSQNSPQIRICKDKPLINIPYIDFNLNIDFLEGLILGPNFNIDRYPVDSIKSILQKKSIKLIGGIQKSGLPYRNINL
ncbi:hypothetical protein TRIP_D390009 [uncultured Paludibacter sp.]|uniref:DUF2971 domain-containing protein n=1 Tax=uncultured Paludibacter sp. TaxID=497635 RepID=A0A653AE54_9BACT|nr:hypothetical protein TRIP_D390009 [uncultured Paludibacter sp.]